MSISKEGAFILLVLAINIKHKKIEDYIARTEAGLMESSIRNIHIEASVDSLKVQIKGLGKSVIFLDSCQQNKTIKQDRAERRGKFVGGLIKSLIPGM
jgi:predicted secreted Zn-dependent protease